MKRSYYSDSIANFLVSGSEGRQASPVLEALEGNRILILEMRNQVGNIAAAKERNRFVITHSDKLWLPYVSPGGMLDCMIKDMGVEGKVISLTCITPLFKRKYGCR